MTVRFEKTEKGEVAILPRAEYETLLARAAEADEDEGTARLVARARRSIAAGEPLIPIEVADRIANGESPIKAFREWRRLTQIQLSDNAGIGQGYLSDLENGRRTGTIAALRDIAAALEVPLEVIVME